MKPDASLVQRWIRPEIQALSAYHVPPARGFIKLDAMENPYGWPPELVQAWLDTLRSVELNRYPDPGASELSDALRRVMQVPAGMQVVLGNGSDELIQMLALAVAAPGRVVLAPEPTFVMYRMIAQVAGMRYQAVALADDFSLDSGATLAAIETHAPAIVFLAYPNNPTGTLFDARVVEGVIGAAPGLVVVDEAYAPFTDASFMCRLGEFPNLLVMRTVSKMGLAGLRLGLLAGLAAFTKLFSDAYAAKNIRMNNVLPGFIDSLPEKEEFRSRIPMERYGSSAILLVVAYEGAVLGH